MPPIRNPQSTFCNPLPRFLPGRLWFGRGTFADYRRLCGFHYAMKDPAVIADIRVIRFRADHDDTTRVVAVAAIAHPVPSCHAREDFLSRRGYTRSVNLRFAQRHIRTISRVIVHPQFRALGLATLLVRHCLRVVPTRYVEAASSLARLHPMFDRAGMKRIEPTDASKPVYFIFDRKPCHTRDSDPELRASRIRKPRSSLCEPGDEPASTDPIAKPEKRLRQGG